MMKPANRAALITVAALMTLALAAGAAVAMFPDGEAVTPTDLQELAKYRFVIDDGGSWELTLDEDEFALLEITPQYSGTWTFVSSGETAGGGDPWVQIYDAEGEPVDFADIARLPGSMAFSAGTLRYAVISVNWSMTDLEPADGQTFTVSVSHVDSDFAIISLTRTGSASTPSVSAMRRHISASSMKCLPPGRNRSISGWTTKFFT